MIELTSQISDHYTEANEAIQDQIALMPETITVNGYVGELVYTKPVAPRITNPTDPLVDNPAMVPQLTPGAQQTQAQTTATNDAQVGSVETAQTLYTVFDRLSGQKPNQTAQQKILSYFYQLWKSRQLFSVETAWGTMNSMAIQNIRAAQTEETKDRSEFRIVFKHMRFAQPVSVNTGQLAGRAFAQRSPVVQNGAAGLATPTTAESQSLIRKWTKGLVSP